jgi:adenine-specific DNA-methyltransferase
MMVVERKIPFPLPRGSERRRPSPETKEAYASVSASFSSLPPRGRESEPRRARERGRHKLLHWKTMLTAMVPKSGKTLVQARALRRTSAPTERILWKELRAHRLHGKKIRRQVPLGPYIVDFFCREACLIIEVDGGVHQEERNRRRDARRERYLNRRGFRVLRFENHHILESLDEVLTRIAMELSVYPSP